MEEGETHLGWSVREGKVKGEKKASKEKKIRWTSTEIRGITGGREIKLSEHKKREERLK